jgi:VanZ family protein
MIAALARAWQKPRGLLLDVAPAALCLVVLFWAGLVPLESLPGPDFELKDKAWHLLAFGGLSGLLARAIAHFRRDALLAARDAALVGVALGGLLELLQGLTPYRSPDWADFVADSLGAALAYLLLRVIDAAATPRTAGA